MSIKKLFDNIPAAINIDNTFIIQWSEPGTGWGEFTFYKDEDGGIHCDNECMSKEFVKKIMNRFIDEIIFDDG